MKIGSKGQVYRSAEGWRELIREYEQSGMKQAEYCGSKGIAQASFCEALSRYGKKEPTCESFIEVLHSAGVKGQERTLGYRVELELGSSMVLRIRWREEYVNAKQPSAGICMS